MAVPRLGAGRLPRAYVTRVITRASWSIVASVRYARPRSMGTNVEDPVAEEDSCPCAIPSATHPISDLIGGAGSLLPLLSCRIP